MAWIITVFLKFSLATYVAIFEPATRIRQTLGRSNYLLRQGGSWFLIKGSVLMLVVELIVSLLKSRSSQQPSGIMIVILVLAELIVLTLINGSLVMLYRNRRAVKGQSDLHTPTY